MNTGGTELKDTSKKINFCDKKLTKRFEDLKQSMDDIKKRMIEIREAYEFNYEKLKDRLDTLEQIRIGFEECIVSTQEYDTDPKDE